MARPNLGSKRVCSSCGAKFYDLGKDPTICPECGAARPQASFLKPRRAKPPPAPRAVPKQSAPKDEDEDDIALDSEDEDDGDVEDLDDDNDLGDVVAGSAKKDGEDDG